MVKVKFLVMTEIAAKIRKSIDTRHNHAETTI
jgi:hypothetical protein